LIDHPLFAYDITINDGDKGVFDLKISKTIIEKQLLIVL